MRFHLVALFTIFVWGVTFVSTKVLLRDLTPLWILLLRFAIGFLVLCALRPRILRLQERRHELLFLAAGATGIAGYYLLENVALVFTTATAVGVIVAASPLFTALLQAMLGDRSAMHARFFAGFAVAMTGLAIVGFGSGGEWVEGDSVGAMLAGDALALLAALVWAVYSVLVKGIADLGYETIASTKRTFLWGLALILPATLLFGGGVPSVDAISDLVDAGNLLFLGAVASAACFVMWGACVRNLGAAVATTYIYLVPAITATASIILLGEPFTPPIVIGVALTVTGLIISHRQGE